MNNYEYIIASLPVLNQDISSVSHIDEDGIIADIMEQGGQDDRNTIDFLLSGYEADKLGMEFYSKALKHKSRFIREFFGFDLDLRNAKVRYINKSLGRENGPDVLVIPEREETEFEEEAAADAVLNGNDILARERGLDDLIWKKIEDITIMDVFSLDLILGFIAKLKIITRWLKLDPGTGRDMFRKLVEEIRNDR